MYIFSDLLLFYVLIVRFVYGSCVCVCTFAQPVVFIHFVVAFECWLRPLVLSHVVKEAPEEDNKRRIIHPPTCHTTTFNHSSPLPYHGYGTWSASGFNLQYPSHRLQALPTSRAQPVHSPLSQLAGSHRSHSAGFYWRRFPGRLST